MIRSIIARVEICIMTDAEENRALQIPQKNS